MFVCWVDGVLYGYANPEPVVVSSPISPFFRFSASLNKDMKDFQIVFPFSVGAIIFALWHENVHHHHIEEVRAAPDYRKVPYSYMRSKLLARLRFFIWALFVVIYLLPARPRS